MSCLWSHRRLAVTLWYLHPSAQFTPSISSCLQSGLLFYHGTHLTSEPWHLYKSGIMFTVIQCTRSYAIALGGFALAGAFTFAHIQLAAGCISCSLVLVNPLHGMWMFCFYFSIIFFIRLVCIGSIYSASRFSFPFIIFSACFIYLSYLVVLSSHICLGPIYTSQYFSFTGDTYKIPSRFQYSIHPMRLQFSIRPSFCSPQ